MYLLTNIYCLAEEKTRILKLHQIDAYYCNKRNDLIRELVNTENREFEKCL